MSIGILLSGAGGVIGSEFFQELLKQEQRSKHYEIVCLFRSDRSRRNFEEKFSKLFDHRVSCLTCDLTNLADVDAVTKRMSDFDYILGVHCAANVAWHLALDEMIPINVEGACRFCDILSAAGPPASLIYVSSAYTSPSNWVYRNAYEESKAIAERRVREKYAKLQVTTFSCSLVVGSSQSGEISRFHGLYPLIRYMSSPEAPFLVGRKDCLIDIVPIDWVTRELLALAQRKLENSEAADVVAAAGATRISLEDLAAAIETEINQFRVKHGLDEKKPTPIISHRQWSFLRRSLDTWKVESLPLSKFRSFERLLEVYRPYTQHDAVLPPQNVVVPAPDPRQYLGLVTQYWLLANRALLLQKYERKV